MSNMDEPILEAVHQSDFATAIDEIERLRKIEVAARDVVNAKDAQMGSYVGPVWAAIERLWEALDD